MCPETLRNPVTQLQEGPEVHPAVLTAKNIRPYTDKVIRRAASPFAHSPCQGHQTAKSQIWLFCNATFGKTFGAMGITRC